jgi:curli biogenesis system outer membrane secretion channel CsgG
MKTMVMTVAGHFYVDGDVVELDAKLRRVGSLVGWSPRQGQTAIVYAAHVVALVNVSGTGEPSGGNVTPITARTPAGSAA